jgi:putative nucleotidyltransferase with HDIG domain
MATQEAPLVQTGRPWVVAQLHPFPPVAAQLMRMVSTDDADFGGMAELIRVDTTLSAEVLRLANSPLLGCRRKILSILHAVAILGMERLKGLVMMVALRNFLAGALHMPSLLRCWRHSLAVAFLAQDIGSACWLDRDQCYTAGLMHDLGRLALLATFPSHYAEVLEHAEETGGDVLAAERRHFEVDHCTIGCWLVSDWELPEDFLDIVGTHHADLPRGEFDMVQTVRVACRLADALGFHVVTPRRPAGVGEILRELPAQARERLGAPEDLLVELAGKINAVECSLI